MEEDARGTCCMGKRSDTNRDYHHQSDLQNDSTSKSLV